LAVGLFASRSGSGAAAEPGASRCGLLAFGVSLSGLTLRCAASGAALFAAMFVSGVTRSGGVI